MSRIRQNLSSDSLFHFIKRREWLISILKSRKFQAYYVYEEIPELRYKVGMPMKCFCDIPLGMIKKHMAYYGKFGVGISKKYAKKKCFSPVIYVHENSDTLLRYIKSLKKGDVLKGDHSLLPYFKWDERQTKSKSGNILATRYYDEREWRYIPPNPEFIDFTGFDEEEIRKIKIEEENKRIGQNPEKYILPFDYSDITYLFVQQDEDVDKVTEEIRKLKINVIEQDRLIAKIITSRQIERDF